MGEYAKYNGNEIKIGTCEEMLYLRYEDRHQVGWIRGNVDPATDMGLFWRLPLPAEDGCEPGGYVGPETRVQLRRGNEWLRLPELAEHGGEIRMTHPCGYTLPVPCYHGERLPGSGGECGIQWQGGSAGCFYELVSVKNTVRGVLPVIQCRHCGRKWSCEWSDVLDWIPCEVLRARLAVHAVEPVPAA